MFAEFFGKEDGYCHGRGGSMHIADVDKGNLGANGIVGGGLPIAVGAALAIKRHEARRRRTVCFFGDGANNEGAFHEALNMASIWKLPVIFVCENNQYGMSTSTERSTAVKRISRARRRLLDAGRHRRRQRLRGRRRGDARGDRARPRRRGPEPGREHDLSLARPFEVRPQPLPHQGRDRRAGSPRDPIERFRTELVAHGVVTEETADMLLQEAEAEVAAGIEFAKASPAPSVADVTRDVYAGAQ